MVGATKVTRGLGKQNTSSFRIFKGIKGLPGIRGGGIGRYWESKCRFYQRVYVGRWGFIANSKEKQCLKTVGLAEKK